MASPPPSIDRLGNFTGGAGSFREVVIPFVSQAASVTLPVYLLAAPTYIESVKVISKDGSDAFTLDVQNGGTGGTGTTSLLSGGAYAMSALTANVAASVGVNQNQVLAVGEMLKLVLTRSSGTLVGSVTIRYSATLGKVS